MSITRLESFGSKAVTTETAIIECGSINIKYAFAYGVKPTPVVIQLAADLTAALVAMFTVTRYESWEIAA